MSKVIRAIGAPHKPGTHRKRRFVHTVVRPVVADVAGETPMRIEIVSQRASEAARHVRDVKRRWSVVVAVGRGNHAAGMQPLISHKSVPLRGYIALRQRGTREK